MYYRCNFTNSSTSVWALQVKNVLGSPNSEGYEYNYKTKSIKKSQWSSVIPVLSYKIEF